MDLVCFPRGDKVAVVAFLPEGDAAVLVFFLGGGVGIESGSDSTLSS